MNIKVSTDTVYILVIYKGREKSCYPIFYVYIIEFLGERIRAPLGR